MVDSKRAEAKASSGVAKRLGALVLLVAVAGGAAWFVRREQGRVADGCLDELLDVKLGAEGRALALDAIATGTLKVEGDSAGARNMRTRLSVQASFLRGLEECRRIHYLDGEPPAPMELQGDALVTISQTGSLGMDGDPRPTGVRMSADDPKFGECTTDHRGRCYLAFKGVTATDRVTITSDFSGTTPQDKAVLDLIGNGAHFVVQRRDARFDRVRRRP